MTENAKVPLTSPSQGDHQNAARASHNVAATDVNGTAGQGTVDLPWQFKDPAMRFVPLYRDRKDSLWRDDQWQRGMPYHERLGQFFAGTATLANMPKDPNDPPLPVLGGDVGVRLDRCGDGLVLLDADVVLNKSAAWPLPPLGPTQFPNAMGTRFYDDGRAELLAWAEQRGVTWEPTLMLESAGRPDGSHANAPGTRGWHLYYWQNPEYPIRQGVNLMPNCEVKVRGIARLTREMSVLRDLPIAVMPVELARAICTTPGMTGQWDGEEHGGGAIDPSSGYNNALTALKAWLLGRGHWWDEEQANAVVRCANSVLPDPMDERRLESTVLKHKARWVKQRDEDLARAAEQAELLRGIGGE